MIDLLRNGNLCNAASRHLGALNLNRFTIRGEVIPFVERQRNIRVENADELRRWWEEHHIDTKLSWQRPDILIILSAARFVHACRIGDIVDYTIEYRDQANGRRIFGVALAVVTPAVR